MREPFRGSEAMALGLLSRAQLRGRAMRRLFRDVYVDAEAEPTHELRCRAATLVLPECAAISGHSAAHLHGAGLPDADAPVEVTTDHRVRRQAGLVVHRSSLCADDVVRMRGLRVTTRVRTAFDLARRDELDEAVVAVDALLTLGRLTVAEIATYAAQRRSWPGTRQLPLPLHRRGRAAASRSPRRPGTGSPGVVSGTLWLTVRSRGQP